MCLRKGDKKSVPDEDVFVEPPTNASAMEIFDYLTVLTKALMFDLEATRRENTFLRKSLDFKNPVDGDGTGHNSGAD